ncbi:MAG: insulinase family protein [Desulfobacteraceae bacterium]|nr:insulinase family protein [Desulfobacteraceae bacterium]
MKTLKLPILLYLTLLIFGCSNAPDMVSTQKSGKDRYSADEIRRMTVDQPFLISGDYFREQEREETGKTPLPRWPHEDSDLKPDPAVLFGKLPNGFRYVVMENSNPKNRISMHLYVNAGSLNETDAQKGLAHFMEHMAFNGSEHFAPGEMVKFFQKIGMQFGPDANAHTGLDRTVYDVLLPKNEPEIIKEGLIVLRDYAHGVLLLPSEIDRERKVVLAEKRTRDSISYRTYVSEMKFEFPESRIPERLVIGDEKVLETADQKLLKDYYETWYRPENIILVVVGDTDKQLAEKLIKGQFSDITAKSPSRPYEGIGKIHHQGTKPFYHLKKKPETQR